MFILENNHFNFKCEIIQILYENRSHFIRSERLQEIRIMDMVSFLLIFSRLQMRA